jgi:signal transduction histidine kinase
VTKPLDFPVVLARVKTQLAIKRLSDLKDQFFRIASHDLKNPLTAVLTGASLFPRLFPVGSTMTEKGEDVARRIHRRAREMQRIIEDFLDFQALEGGGLELHIEPTDLGELLKEVVESNRDYAEKKRIEVTFEPPSDLPRAPADRDRLVQVAQNLVGNAIKFSPPGAPVRVAASTQDGAVAVEVIDNGPGLTDDDLDKLFQRYSRLSNKPTGGEKSSGLGLSICKQLIDLHGGQIGARNNEGGGATFWFRLPVD